MNNNILIVSGEPSGDIRAGELVAELKKLEPGWRMWGIGGDRMESQGVELMDHIRRFSMVGAWETVKNLSRIRLQYKKLTENIIKRKPDLAILVDYPGFNLKVAKFIHSRKIPVIYYIIPQVWAWGRWRMNLLKKFVTSSLVLFKFEKDFLSRYGVPCEFVGHPLIDAAEPYLADAHQKEHNQSDKLTLALLPGSRETEVRKTLPIMLGAASIMQGRDKKMSFSLAENSNVHKNIYEEALKNYRHLPIERFKDSTMECLAGSDFAVVTSGTATLETAVMNKPLVIVYRAAHVTYFIYRLVAKTRFLGLINIIAGKEIAPELLQYDLTPEKLSDTVLKIIEHPDRMREMKENLRKVSEYLGQHGAARRAAKAISRFI